MAGLALMLNTAEQTLRNTQTELATSSNNISNANTPGYAVEKAVQTQDPSIQATGGWIGTGASIAGITQARDTYIEQELMNATSSDGQYTTLAAQLGTIESAASDTGSDGISSPGKFFRCVEYRLLKPDGLLRTDRCLLDCPKPGKLDSKHLQSAKRC